MTTTGISSKSSSGSKTTGSTYLVQEPGSLQFLSTHREYVEQSERPDEGQMVQAMSKVAAAWRRQDYEVLSQEAEVSGRRRTLEGLIVDDHKHPRAVYREPTEIWEIRVISLLKRIVEV